MDDEGFDLQPPGVEAPGPTAETAAEGAAGIAAPAPAPLPLGRSWALDFAQRRFIPGTAGGPLAVRGDDTLRQWVEKCLRTPRGGAPAVDPQFGVDVLPHEVFDGGPFDLDVATEAMRDWRTAIEQHPRVVSVEDMRMDGSLDSDVAVLSFRVLTEGTTGAVEFRAGVDASGLTRI